jgi:NAD(P)-dependent dehydrogenase (short-subunit alcohol dehydrogenase family)
MPKAGEHVVVVGGTSGMGLPLARAAHALGCTVTITGRGADRASEVAKSIGPGATGRHVDLEDTASIRAAFADGPVIDHAVLMPLYSSGTNVKDFNAGEANRVLQIKLTGYVAAVSAMLPRLKPSSSIVLLGGLAKHRPFPNSTMVTITNAGIVGMMKTMAIELAPIRVNSVSPGLVADSPKWDAAVKSGTNPLVAKWAARTPTHQLPAMTDVIHAVFFLLDNRSVNAHDLEIDGGIQWV